MSQFVGITVSEDAFEPTTIKTPITPWVLCPQPGPALIRAALINFWPKAHFWKYGLLWVSLAAPMMTVDKPVAQFSQLSTTAGAEDAGSGRIHLHGESPFVVPRSRSFQRRGSTFLPSIIAQEAMFGGQHSMVRGRYTRL